MPTPATYQPEPLCTLWNELAPLAANHWREIHGPLSGGFSPDRERYEAVESAGLLRIYTARDHDGALIGYAAYIVAPDLHDTRRITATADGLYVPPSHRPLGIGTELLRYAIADLQTIPGVAIEQHVTTACDFGSVLLRLGFVPSFTTYVLNQEPPCPQPLSPP